MKQKRTFLKIIVIIFVCVNSTIFAQTYFPPYFEGFEDFKIGSVADPSHDGWVLVNGQRPPNYDQFPNKWCFGNATAADGKMSLFISANNGNTANYQNSTVGVAAWKEFTLPAGFIYQISFDYKFTGEVTQWNEIDYLYACWVTNPTTNIIASSMGIPADLYTFRRQIVKPTSGEWWHHCDFDLVRGSDTPGRLVFYWINDGKGNYPPSGCIDNIQISQVGSPCDKPTSLNVIYDNGLRVSWDDTTAPLYEIKYQREYSTGKSGEWTEIQGVSGSPHVISGAFYKGEVITVWVRAICGDYKSAWAVKKGIVIP